MRSSAARHVSPACYRDPRATLPLARRWLEHQTRTRRSMAPPLPVQVENTEDTRDQVRDQRPCNGPCADTPRLRCESSSSESAQTPGSADLWRLELVARVPELERTLGLCRQWNMRSSVNPARSRCLEPATGDVVYGVDHCARAPLSPTIMATTTSTMLAAEFSPDSAVLKLKQVPKPTPANDEVLLRVRACGVCHSDVRTGVTYHPTLKSAPRSCCSTGARRTTVRSWPAMRYAARPSRAPRTQSPCTG